MNTSEHDFTIVLVEDEAVLREEMAFQLEHKGFKVQGFESAPQLYRYLSIQRNAIIVLDIGLPGEDGVAICKYLREHDPLLGIIFVTARGQHDDKITGLTAGADAYLTKPIDMNELALILKRLATRFLINANKSDLQRSINKDGWHMDSEKLILVTPNKMRIILSYNESQLLRTLLGGQGAACTHAELGVSIGIDPDELEKHRIEVIVSRLCSKVKRSCGLSLPVQSVRGVGYALEQEYLN
jgi:DNA-binding response OmpR family regulator